MVAAAATSRVKTNRSMSVGILISKVSVAFPVADKIPCSCATQCWDHTASAFPSLMLLQKSSLSLLLSAGLIIHEGSSVYRIFKRWQAVNQQWKVLNYDKAKDLGEPIGGSTKPGGRNSRTNPSSGSERTSQRSQRVRTILNHHCGYTILHILSHLRPNEHRGGSSSSREVVMRVTTV